MQLPKSVYTKYFIPSLAAFSFCYCVYRDIQIEKLYPGDLRNRVVGSRLQMDGKSPYFYHWRSEDGLRYYDTQNFDHLAISNITASPFLHQLLYPIANLPQRAISRIWLGIDYFLLIGMMALSLLIASTRRQRWVILFTTLLFLHTYAWTTNIEYGQNYLVIPFFAMAFYFFISRPASFLNAALAGVFAISLVLTRVSSLLFLLPFLLLLNRYSSKYKMIFAGGALVILAFAFGSSSSRLYWNDYNKAIKEHVRFHQYNSAAPQVNEKIPFYTNWEGWDTEEVSAHAKTFHYKHNGEHGNVFVFVEAIFHKRMPVWLISVSCMALIMICFLFYYTKNNRTPFYIHWIALLGYTLYMMSDLFSPIHRYQYNASQWIFPLLILSAFYSPKMNKLFIAGILAGLLLESVPFSFMPMQRSLGEYVICGSLLGLLFTHKPAVAK